MSNRTVESDRGGTEPPRLSGAVLVTGGGGAIGATICKTVRGWGAEQIFVCDVNAAAASATAESIDGAEPLVLDVADRAAIDAAGRDLGARGVSLRGVVNAAAVLGSSSFPDDSDRDWDRTLRINVRGVYSTVVALRHLLSPGSAVVNIASVEGLYVLASSGATDTAYAASKAAVIGLTRTLAVDLAPAGVRVNCVAPGYVRTPMNQAVFDDPARARFIDSRLPMPGGVASPDDVAGVVAFLLSPLAAYITGQTIVADGGLGLGAFRTGHGRADDEPRAGGDDE